MPYFGRRRRGGSDGDCGPCGLVRYLEEPFYEQVPLPLKSVAVSVDARDFVAEVTVVQEYVNKDADPVEAEYLFPVESDGAVVKFEAEVDGRKVAARLAEKEEARKEYDEAVADQKTAFLAEEAKADVFRIKVGHLKPGAGAKITLTYVTELPAEGEAARLTVPTTIAPRYTPPQYRGYRSSDPDAGDEGIDALTKIRYQLDTPAPLTVDVHVRSSTDLESVSSFSHELKVEEVGPSERKASLAGTVTDMDRDFLLLIKSKEIHRPRMVLETREGTKAAMASLVPSFNLREHPVELVFLVDRSGSMHGPGIEQAKKALQLFLHSLPAGCLFNIVSFGSRHSALFDGGSAEYDDDSLARAKAHVAEMQANFGGTEIHIPLLKILREEPAAGKTHAKQVLVLTDGSVSNDEQVLAMVRREVDAGWERAPRVFSLGLGDGCSRHLVKGLARAGGGTAAFAAEGEDLRPRVMAQLKNALQPAIREVRCEWIGSGRDESADLRALADGTGGERRRGLSAAGPDPGQAAPGSTTAPACWPTGCSLRPSRPRPGSGSRPRRRRRPSPRRSHWTRAASSPTVTGPRSCTSWRPSVACVISEEVRT